MCKMKKIIGDMLYPFEIKSAMTAVKEFSGSLKRFCEAEKTAGMPTVIYAGKENQDKNRKKQYGKSSFVSCLSMIYFKQ